ncbi:MAG: transcription elongation factor GreA [Acidobacteria bacterium]|nr:transcription elongation factor GreA [Acidobacteriota bacterium]
MSDALRKKLEEEIRALEYELNYELPLELKKATAQGDLSENAEYLTARQRQDYVKARLRQLGKRLADISLLNFNNIPRNRVAFGSTVTLHDVDKGTEVEYKIVTSEEADVAKGRISTSSPIGRSLMGKQVGDSVTVQTPSGRKEFEILKLTTIHDADDAD